jgi:hypothetical protein
MEGREEERNLGTYPLELNHPLRRSISTGDGAMRFSSQRTRNTSVLIIGGGVLGPLDSVSDEDAVDPGEREPKPGIAGIELAASGGMAS